MVGYDNHELLMIWEEQMNEHRPYSKMTADLIFFRVHINWPRFQSKNYLYAYKRILNRRPFLTKVYKTKRSDVTFSRGEIYRKCGSDRQSIEYYRKNKWKWNKLLLISINFDFKSILWHVMRTANKWACNAYSSLLYMLVWNSLFLL